VLAEINKLKQFKVKKLKTLIWQRKIGNKKKWERDFIHVFGNNNNVYFDDGMNVTVHHQSQEASNQQAEEETIPQLEARMDTEQERMRLLPCKRKGPM
jgi:hypothetical protein